MSGMRALLDINVLIAILDQDHASHARAIEWFAANAKAKAGWASCPLTQNGCMRIMSHPSYPNALPIRAIMQRLQEAATSAVHEFWSDDISLLDDSIADFTRIHGHRQLTDIYLLALAVRHKGCLVTFDTAIPLAAIKHAKPQNLLVL